MSTQDLAYKSVYFHDNVDIKMPCTVLYERTGIAWRVVRLGQLNRKCSLVYTTVYMYITLEMRTPSSWPEFVVKRSRNVHKTYIHGTRARMHDEKSVQISRISV